MFKAQVITTFFGAKYISNPAELHMADYLNKKLLEFFGNHDDVKLWVKTPNPLLGMVTPEKMFRQGKYDKLARFIEEQIDQN